MHQLIVIGNGFDLACGLHSRFSDFMKSRYDGDGNWLLEPEEETAWDIILSSISEDDSLWCDIESTIAKWVIGDEGKAKLTSALTTRLPDLGEDRYRELSINALRLQLESHNPELGIYDSSASHIKHKESEGFDFLLSELHLFEKAFDSYLWNEVISSSSYTDNAKKAFKRLVSEDIEYESNAASTSIINFNYTKVELLRNVVMHNVHGSLESGNIVIGIDAKGVGDGSLALPFTKTYRLLALKPIMHESLVHPAGSVDPTYIIKFYGHSLAAADYSYFQALFDTVDLYGSNVVLGFYYSKYKGGSGNEISDSVLRERQYRMVSHLLMSYGDTIDNKAHGDNLMHKLLLEGRLFIKKIAFPAAL